MPDISVVIPIYNEQAVLEQLFSRLYPTLDAMQRPYEIIFIDDGSRDDSVKMLRDQYQVRPDVTKVVLLRANAGQHAAILAGFKYSKGKYIVTLDADLQNPPEEIPKIIEKMDEGYDYVGSIRDERRDKQWRNVASKAMNILREKITQIKMTDQGCMFRGYHKDIVEAMVASNESQTFIPALAYLYAANPTEIVIQHSERAAGESKYSFFRLVHLNFDLITSFSTIPLQFFSLVGMGISALSFLFVLYMALRRLIIGPEVQGVFTLFAIAFFMIGLLLFAVGVLGEYIARIYSEVRNRPRYLVATVLEPKGSASSPVALESTVKPDTQKVTDTQ